MESGEKLYPSTATEGRDIIRQELRTLRDQWEQVCDLLSDTQHKLDSCLLQWSSYDENFEQFQKWLLDTEIQLKEDTDLKATLPDKKAQLQNHRVRIWDNTTISQFFILLWFFLSASEKDT